MGSMLKLRYTEFINRPIVQEIEQSLNALSSTSSGIQNYPLKEYFLKSLFLNLTGSQEQKLRCICWDLATVDNKFRYSLLRNDLNFHEYSNIEDKKKVFSQLCRMIATISAGNIDDVYSSIDRAHIAKESKDEIISILDKSILCYWSEREFKMLKNDNRLFKDTHFAQSTLLETTLAEVYEKLYEHRNRCAHNLMSYQENTPTMHSLKGKDRLTENYFTWFALLNLIDKVFIVLYNRLFNEYEAIMY